MLVHIVRLEVWGMTELMTLIHERLAIEMKVLKVGTSGVVRSGLRRDRAVGVRFHNCKRNGLRNISDPRRFLAEWRQRGYLKFILLVGGN